MKRFICIALLFVFLLSACAVGQAGETTASAPVFSHYNEKGPFDDDHYNIAFRALYSIERYLTGDQVYASVLSLELRDCLDEIYRLPKTPKDDPLFAGNEFVRTYVFLASTDCSYHIGDFEKKIKEDRDLLAAAIGVKSKNLLNIEK